MPQAVTPAYDNKIYQKYSKKMIQNKEKNKSAFCQEFGLSYNSAIPLLCVTYPLTEKNEVGNLQEILTGLLEQNAELILMAVGTPKYQQYFTELADEFPEKITLVEDTDENRRKVYAASDMAIAASDNAECLEEMNKAMKYGAVPVSPPADFLENYDAVQESGNAFIYEKRSSWSLFAAVVRALENFRFPYDWKNIRLSAMDGEVDPADE